jgi:cytochrome c peroxidase
MRRGTGIPLLAAGLLVVLVSCHDAPTAVDRAGVTPPEGSSMVAVRSGGDIIALGGLLYEDENLSVYRNQSCRTCHEPSEGFAAPLAAVVTRGSVVQGSVSGRFGDRKPPSAAYATLAPNYSGGNNPTGGVFWDGRATGALLGNPAADQALGPFLNPVEQALPDKACVVFRLVDDAGQRARYEAVFPAAWWADILSINFPNQTTETCRTPVGSPGEYVGLTGADRAKVDRAYNNIALAVAAFEDTFNKFSSRFDKGQLTAQEQQGQKLFSGKGKCQQCHGNKGSKPLFTDFAYHNLGVPRNPANPMYVANPGWVDLGLGAITGNSKHAGKFRTPTIRNVGKGENRTFMHNGAIVSLVQVVDFYNTRDALPECKDPAVLRDPKRWGSRDFGGAGCWPPPEHRTNLDTKQMGKLGLSQVEVEAIVAYMKAMTDS